MRLKIPTINAPLTPKFVWLKSCKHCPSKFKCSPEVEDILKEDREFRMSTVFACAWRSDGFCSEYYKKMWGEK